MTTTSVHSYNHWCVIVAFFYFQHDDVLKAAANSVTGRDISEVHLSFPLLAEMRRNSGRYTESKRYDMYRFYFFVEYKNIVSK